MNTKSSLFTEQMDSTNAFSAPLGAVKQGCLEITRGLSNADLSGDATIPDLFQGEFTGMIPEVRTRKERVTIHYPVSLHEWIKHLFLANRHAAKITLNASIPWKIDIHGGVAHLDADLRALQLSSVAIRGGVAETDILLPSPVGMVSIKIGSGVSQLRISRPEGIDARLSVGGGINHLTFDDRFYDSVGGGIRLETPDYRHETNRYDIRVRGGVSNLIIGTQV